MLKRDRKRILALLTLLAVLIGIFTQPAREASANGVSQLQQVSGTKLTTSLEDGPGSVVNLELDVIEIVNIPVWEHHPYSDKYWVGSGANRKMISRGSKMWLDETPNGKLRYHESRNIKIQYIWNTKGATQLNKGDYFLVPLPQADRFEFTEENKRGIIKGKVIGDDTHTIDLGTFEIVAPMPFQGQSTLIHYAKLTLNDAAAQRGVENGLFTLIGSTSKMEEQTPYLLYAPLNKMVEISYGKDFEPDGNNLGTGNHIPSRNFDKYSSVDYKNKNITWTLSINEYYLRDLYEFSKEGQPAKQLEQKDNVIIVDELPNGVQDPTSFYIRPSFHVPYDRRDNDDSIRQLGNHELDVYNLYVNYPRLGDTGKDYYNNVMEPFITKHLNKDVIQNTGNLDFQAFVDDLKAQDKAGIFVESDGTRKLIYVFKNTPLNITYYNYFNGSLDDNSPDKFNEFIDAYTRKGGNSNRRMDWINERQAKIMKEVYGPQGPSGGRLAYVRAGYTTVLNDPVNGEAYINHVTMNYDGAAQPEEATRTQQYVTSAAQGEIPEIHVSKVWGSSDSAWNETMKNSDEEIAVTITPYGIKSGKTYQNFVQYAKLSKSNNWKTIVRMPIEIINKEKIEYKVEESIDSSKEYKLGSIDRVPGSKTYIKDWTITNVKKDEVEKIKIDVSLITCDNSPKAPPVDAVYTVERRLKAIQNDTFVALADPKYTRFVSANVGETAFSFTDLEKYNESRQEYEYRVVQDLKGTHNLIVTEEMQTDPLTGNLIAVFKNCTPTASKISVQVETTDCGDHVTTPPQNVTVKLQRKTGNSSYEDVMKLNNTDEIWTQEITTNDTGVTFDGLPKTNAQDEVYTYIAAVTSGEIQGYKTEVLGKVVADEQNPSSIKVRICALPVQPSEKTTVIVQTVDCSNSLATPPEEVTVKLQKSTDGVNFEDVKDPTDSNQIWTKTFNTSENSVKFEELPKKDDQGHAYTYKVEVTSGAIADHKMEVSDDGIAGDNNANTIKIKICPVEKINVTVQHKDCSDTVVEVPDDIAIILERKLADEGDLSYAPVVENGQKVQTVLQKEQHSTHTFSDLPKSNDKGKEYVYRVTMNPTQLNGYVTTLSDHGEAKSSNGYTVTIKNCKNFDVTVQNKNCANEVTVPPVDFTITLQRKLKGAGDDSFANVKVNGVDLISTLSKAGNGTYQFTDLPKFSPSGVEYVYKVVFNPDKVDQYETTIEDAGIVREDKGFVVTVKNCPLGTGGPSNPPSNPTPPTTPDPTPDDSSSDNSGSGTVSHVERLTPDPNKPQGSQKPQDPNKAQDPKNPQSPSDSGSNSDTSSGNTTTEKPVDPITGNTASTDGPSTDVKPGAVPGLSSGTGTKNPNTAVDPANKGKLPKTGEGLNMETYAMMLAFLGVSLVGYGVWKRKRINH